MASMQAAAATTHLSSTGSISAGKVQSTDVYNTKGDHLGHVDDLMIDKMSGKVSYAIMAFGGFLGIGERYHPLPWSLLKYDIAKGGYIVPLDKAMLEKGPHYDRAELGDDDLAWRERVYGYYQAPPYWM